MKPNVLRASVAQRLFAATQAADGEAKWSVLFPYGEWHGANLAGIGGSINLTEDVFKEMVASWEDQGRPELPVYWHHVSHLDPDLIPPDQLAEVFRQAGHIIDFRITARGLEARTDWSTAGKADVDSGAYVHWSAEWQRGYQDRRTGEVVQRWCVTGAALTDNPFFDTLPRLAAAAAAPPPQSGPAPQEHEAMKKRILAALAAMGIQPNTNDNDGDEAFASAIEQACNKAKAEAESAITSKVTAAKEPVEKLLASAQAALADEKKAKAGVEAELAKLKADGKAKAKDAFLASLSGYGAKAREHLGEVWDVMGEEKAKAFASAMGPTVDTKEKGVTIDAAPAETLTAEDKKKLKASYDDELDAEIKKLSADGITGQVAVVKASKALIANPKFAPLFKS